MAASPSPSPGEASHAAAAALERLGSADAAQRAHAVQDIGHAPLTTEETKIAIVRLAELANDPEVSVRTSLAEAVAHLRGGATEAAAILSRLTRDTQASVRLAAVGALKTMGPAAVEAVPALVERLADEDLGVRREAARALARVGGARFDSAVAALADALRTSKDAGLREEAAHALSEAGHNAAALAALLDALNDRDARVREEALHALGYMPATHADHVLPALRTGLRDTDESVRAAAVRAAARLGVPGLSVLVEALLDSALIVRWWATVEIGNLGPSARDAVPALQRALQDEKPGVREAAARALTRLGSPVPSPSPP